MLQLGLELLEGPDPGRAEAQAANPVIAIGGLDRRADTALGQLGQGGGKVGIQLTRGDPTLQLATGGGAAILGVGRGQSGEIGPGIQLGLVRA